MRNSSLRVGPHRRRAGRDRLSNACATNAVQSCRTCSSDKMSLIPL